MSFAITHTPTAQPDDKCTSRYARDTNQRHRRRAGHGVRHRGSRPRRYPRLPTRPRYGRRRTVHAHPNAIHRRDGGAIRPHRFTDAVRHHACQRKSNGRRAPQTPGGRHAHSQQSDRVAVHVPRRFSAPRDRVEGQHAVSVVRGAECVRRVACLLVCAIRDRVRARRRSARFRARDRTSPATASASSDSSRIRRTRFECAAGRTRC